MKDLVALAMLCLPWLSIGCDEDHRGRGPFQMPAAERTHYQSSFQRHGRTFSAQPCNEPAAYRRHEINRKVYFYSGGTMVCEWLTDQATIRHNEHRCRFTDARSGNEVTISGDYLIVACSAESAAADAR